MDSLLEWRQEFPILQNTTYMISHSLGAMPRRAATRLQEFGDTWATRGIRAWAEGWWEMPVTVGNLVGVIIGAGEGEVVMQQNVSICQSIVTSCFDWSKKRNKLVTDGLNFPSNDYIYHGLERQGARVVAVPSPDGMTLPVDLLLDAIDEETQLVSVSHVAFRSSYLQDLAPIVERAHRVGAMVIADLYQSAGTVPVNVRELQVDFATGGSVKWLCGGPGAGYLYVRRDLWDSLQPAATGWMAHAEPFAFEEGPIRYAGDAFRFLNGTPNVPALYAARSGYEIVNEIGVPAIREKSMRQTTRLIELAVEAGFRVNTPRDPCRRGGVVILDVENGKQVTDELIRREVLVDYRPGAGIRIAPHFYTTDGDLAHTIEELRRIVSTELRRDSFMPSTVWRGRIAFGLVSIPVRLHKAARRERVKFRQVYRPAAAEQPAEEPEEPAEAPEAAPEQVVRFHQAPPAEAAGAPILKGFEIQKDQYVVLEPSEIKALRPRTSTELSILEFVSLQEIDPIYFDTSYYVAPEKGGEKPYAILFEALRQSGHVALGTVAMHGREHAVVIRPGARGMILHTLYYANEVRQNEEPAADRGLVGKKELELAAMLVEALEAKFEPAKLKDTFEERLRELIDVRAQSATAFERMETQPEAAPVIDILEALKKSLEKARKPVKSETAPAKTAKPTTKRARG